MKSVPVVVITGYPDRERLDGQLDDAVLLRKPFRVQDLREAIDRAMQRNAPADPDKVVALRLRAAR